MPELNLICLFFCIALIYASAGFGGGSSYLAVMGIFGLSQATMRPTSLVCNIIVVMGGTYILWREGHLNGRKVLPLCVASVPLSFIGGRLALKDHTFFMLLGFSLIAAALLMFFQHYFQPKTIQKSSEKPLRYEILRGGLLGGSIGLLSGMVGIGGGVFLSPILNLMGWDSPKKIAGTASFFILVNSISGLLGQMQQNIRFDWAFMAPLLLAVFIGGQIGSRLSAFKLRQTHIRQVTAALVFYAGWNVLAAHWH